jgi:hypothetical protein
VIVEQPDVDLAVEGGVVMQYGENKAWVPAASMPVDIAGVVAESNRPLRRSSCSSRRRRADAAAAPAGEMVTRGDDRRPR